MKKVAIIIMVVVCICMSGCIETQKEVEGILRIHIRASSDSKADQEVKLAVRDSLIEYLSPLLRKAKDSAEAEKIITEHRNKLEGMINEVLYSCGFYYGCEVKIDTEYFEKKAYGDVVLDSGYYRAVIVNLGTGSGHNWWCVAFPPLCFTLGEDYENVNYKSIIWEIIKKERNNGN